MTVKQAIQAIELYQQIPMQFVDIELLEALQLVAELDIHAYDASLLRCAAKYRAPVLTLDPALARLAKQKHIRVLEAP